jgi:hypothetical protein
MATVTGLWLHHRTIRAASIIIVTMLSLLFALNRGFLMDESWFLAILHRITSGEVLYRDVYYAVPPISAYIATPLNTIFGTEIMVLGVLLTAYFMATLGICWHIARQLGLGYGPRVLIVIGILGYAPPGAIYGSHYNPLALLFYLICFSATLMWYRYKSLEQQEAFIALVIACAAAAFCLCTKQNIGACAIAAIFLSILLGLRRKIISLRALTTAVWLSVIFILICFLIITPVLINGGIDSFIRYMFNQGGYIQFHSTSFTNGLQILFYPEVFSLRRFGQNLPYLFIPVIFLALMISYFSIGSTRDKPNLPVMIFLFFSVVGIWPRFDDAHLDLITPLVLISLLYAWTHLRIFIRPLPKRVLMYGLIAWIGLWARYVGADNRNFFFSSHHRFSELPHHSNIIVHRAWHEKIQRWRNEIRA